MDVVRRDICRVMVVVAMAVGGLFVAVAQSPTSASDAQVSEQVSQPSLMDVSLEIVKYTTQLNDMIGQVKQADSTQVVSLSGEQWKLDFKWKQYYPQVESVIATDDDLMSGVLSYNTLSQSLTDAIDKRTQALKSQKSLDSDFASMQQSKSDYEQMEKDAQSYSLSKSTADKLTALKAQEEIAFGQVQSSYTAIGTACQELGDEQQKVEADSLYSKILISSGRIRSAKYESLFDRCKDYLYGLAAVVMILMFLNMVHTKIASAKKLRESAKAMEKLMKGGDKQYPTI